MNNKLLFMPVVLGLTCAPLGAFAADPKECPPGLEADAPTVAQSIEQADINSGALSFNDINDHGEVVGGGADEGDPSAKK